MYKPILASESKYVMKYQNEETGRAAYLPSEDFVLSSEGIWLYKPVNEGLHPLISVQLPDVDNQYTSLSMLSDEEEVEKEFKRMSNLENDRDDRLKFFQERVCPASHRPPLIGYCYNGWGGTLVPESTRKLLIGYMCRSMVPFRDLTDETLRHFRNCFCYLQLYVELRIYETKYIPKAEYIRELAAQLCSFKREIKERRIYQQHLRQLFTTNVAAPSFPSDAGTERQTSTSIQNMDTDNIAGMETTTSVSGTSSTNLVESSVEQPLVSNLASLHLSFKQE